MFLSELYLVSLLSQVLHCSKVLHSEYNKRNTVILIVLTLQERDLILY